MRKWVKRIAGAYIAFVQKIVLRILLIIVYMIVIGFTRILFFLGNAFGGKTPRRNDASFWRTPEGYDPTMDGSLHQS